MSTYRITNGTQGGGPAPSRTPLDVILVVSISIFLLWFGLKFFLKGKGVIKGLGGLMLIILTYNVLAWSGYFTGLLNKGLTLEQKLYTGIFRLEGKTNVKNP